MICIISPIEQRRHLRDAERAVLAAVERLDNAQLALREAESWTAPGPGEYDQWLACVHAGADLATAEQTLAAAYTAWRAAGGRAE